MINAVILGLGLSLRPMTSGLDLDGFGLGLEVHGTGLDLGTHVQILVAGDTHVFEVH